MTAILGSLYRNVPYLIGDIMISSVQPPKNEVVLPVSGQNSWETPIRWETHYFSDWRQKLISIGPGMMVAWAGRQIDAVMVIRHLRDGYEQCDTSKLAELRKLAASVETLGMKETVLIFLISCSEGWRFFTYDPEPDSAGLRKFKTPWNENAVAAGTGEDALIGALEATYEHDAPNEFNQAVGNLLLAGARMWNLDVTGVGPQLAFGGAYELAIKQNNDLVKIDDVLYITQVYDQKKKGIWTVPVFLKINYYENILIARVFDFTSSKKPEMRTYCVPPVDGTLTLTTEEALANVPDLNASHFATYLKIESNDPTREHSSAHYTYRLKPEDHRNDKRPIVFHYNGGPLPVSFDVHKDYVQSLVAEVIETKKQAGESFP